MRKEVRQAVPSISVSFSVTTALVKRRENAYTVFNFKENMRESPVFSLPDEKEKTQIFLAGTKFISYNMGTKTVARQNGD